MELRYAKDNIDRLPYEYYMEQYRQADPAEISSRLGIPCDFADNEFHLMFMGEVYHISWPDYKVTHEGFRESPGPLEEDIHAKILVLRYLLNASVFPHNGDFRAYRELPSGDLYYRQFQGRCIFRLIRKYGNRMDALDKVMKRMGATEVHGGDRAYELELFDGLYIRFLFWEGDEEFAPSAQILFSSNFPAAFGTYDLAEIGEICIRAFETSERAEQEEM